MNKRIGHIFATRPTVILELPIQSDIQILHPDQIILKIGKRYYDVGAYCYAIRSAKKIRCRPLEVEISSFLEHRISKILQLVEFLSSQSADAGKRNATVIVYVNWLKNFLDWADSSGFYECLEGGEATRCAYNQWAEKFSELNRRQEIAAVTYKQGMRCVTELLEASTGLEDLARKGRNQDRRELGSITEPLSSHDFAHAVALNQSLFDGICDLVLERHDFPYKLLMPRTLGWEESHLWLFPVTMWRLPPHLWGDEREKLNSPYWPYDYANGRLATPEEVAPRYSARLYSRRIKEARNTVALSKARLEIANSDSQHWVRRMLAMVAHDAFLFLFFCNTGANESVAREIETDGQIKAATLNQKFRSIKFRAAAKKITLLMPVTFMPSLRRFMILRRFLLGDKSSPYLFFTLNTKVKQSEPSQIRSGALESLYSRVLRFIDPALPRMASRKLRASVADWYQRHHDASVTAKVLQNSERTVQIHYDAGSVTDHHEELSQFLNCVSEAAKRQRIISISASGDVRPLEEGGGCEDFGHPEALVDNPPVQPDCKYSQGCLFCMHRVLIATEDDTRKIASAAFVMEQLILGPKHEEALRPLISKCDQDLEKIAAFGNFRSMVESIREDVFERGNLTPFFTDKYQLFLELGVIS